MTENRLPDLLAKIAVDPVFAEHARTNPQAVADEYGLDAKAVAMLESLAVSDAADGPAPLAERLSRSSLFFGGSLAAAGDVHTANAVAGDDGPETDSITGPLQAPGNDDATLAGVDDQLNGDMAGGQSLPGGSKAGIIGPEGSADIIGPDGPVADGPPKGAEVAPHTAELLFNPADKPGDTASIGLDDSGKGDLAGGRSLLGPDGLAHDEDGFRPIFHPPTALIDDKLGGVGGLGGPDGPDGLGDKLDGLNDDGVPGGIDVDGLLGHGGPGGPDGLGDKLDGLNGDGLPGGIDVDQLLGHHGPGGLHGAGPLGVDGPSGPGDFAGPGGFGDTGLAAGVTITDVTVTPGGSGGDGQHHGSGTVTVHDEDGTTHVHDYGDDGFIERPPPVTGGDVAPHDGGATGGGEGPHPGGATEDGHQPGAHPDPEAGHDEGPKEPPQGPHPDPDRQPVGDGEGGDPNRAPKGDGEGGDPNQAPAGDGEGSDGNAGAAPAVSHAPAAHGSGAVFVPPTGTEDPTQGETAAPSQTVGITTPQG